MNKKLKAKWIKALRSGSYRQGRGRLVSSSGTRFCCLGVLADIQGCEWMSYANGMIPISPSGRAPWVDDSKDNLPPTRAGGLSHEDQSSLTGMNDSGKSFKAIADYIDSAL